MHRNLSVVKLGRNVDFAYNRVQTKIIQLFCGPSIVWLCFSCYCKAIEGSQREPPGGLPIEQVLGEYSLSPS